MAEEVNGEKKQVILNDSLSNVGNASTEQLFESALEAQNILLREQNPETIRILNEIQAECRKLSNTLLANYNPEGFIKMVIDSLYLAYGYVGMTLVYFGAGRPTKLFEETRSLNLDLETNAPEEIYTDLYGSNVSKVKTIRMLIIALADRMDKLGNLLTDYDAQVKLGRARTKLDEAIIMTEQSCYSISYILTKPRPNIIPVADGGIS